MEPLKIKIDVTKLDKTAFFRAQSGAVYADLMLWPNRDGESKYGDIATIKQDLGKDRREEKAAIIGNAKIAFPAKSKPIQDNSADAYDAASGDDDIPF